MCHPSSLYHLSSFIKPSATLRWLFSQPVGAERPICGLILLHRRAVNTHFCGCQFGEGRQPCGTQHSISSIPSSGNRAGFRTAKVTVFLYPPPSQGTMLLHLNLTHDLEVIFCVVCYFCLLIEVNVYIYCSKTEKQITVYNSYCICHFE